MVFRYFNQSRTGRIHMPIKEGNLQVLSCLVQVENPPWLDAWLINDHFSPEEIDWQEPCLLTFDLENEILSLSARIDRMAGDRLLLLRTGQESRLSQKREFFRVDASIELVYQRADGSGGRQQFRTLANISGGGLRFPASERIEQGEILELEIKTNGSGRGIQCAGEVVRTSDLGRGGCSVALRFIDISARDRERIITFCFAEQRRQLRDKVNVLGQGDQDGSVSSRP